MYLTADEESSRVNRNVAIIHVGNVNLNQQEK